MHPRLTVALGILSIALLACGLSANLKEGRIGGAIDEKGFGAAFSLTWHHGIEFGAAVRLFDWVRWSGGIYRDNYIQDYYDVLRRR